MPPSVVSDVSSIASSSKLETGTGDSTVMDKFNDEISVKSRPDSTHSHVYPQHAMFIDPNEDEDAEYIEDDSPYPEVRSAVANTDDPELPASTLRAWTIGLFWAIIVPGVNQFFFFRFPGIAVGPIVPQLLSYPLGRFWARYMPYWRILGLSLNPGPFTVKEHALITIMASVGAVSAYATDIVAVQHVYYSQRFPFIYQWMLVMATQLIGFSIGGIARRFLVSPPSMIWPANLVLCALFNTLHSQQYAGIGSHGGISRERFFLYAFVGSAVWSFVPGYLFTALSWFTWVCWIAPNNVVINQLFGYYSGMGMSLISFDWQQIAYIGSPLATPWWAEANIGVGFVIFFWILTPILYYTNTWYSRYLPILSRNAFDNAGMIYNVSRVLDRQTMNFNEEAYKAYSPLYISATFAVSYGLSFASITATLVHCFLYFRRQIWIQCHRSLKEQPDIHARLMSVYREVPDWHYGAVFVITTLFAILSVEIWPTQLPVWALFLALFIAFLYVIPIGMIQAITNRQVPLNVVSELIIGYAVPGRPIAMMIFKTFGYIAMSRGLTFTADMKLGHYMKVPPRPMFWAQIVCSVIAATVQLGVQSWLFSNISGMCQPHNPKGFTCPGTQTFATASFVWGVVGPARQFSAGQTYHSLMWFFLAGAIAPFIPYFLIRRYPYSVFRYVNMPVLFAGTSLIPPATAVSYIPWTIVGFIFQYVIRRRHFSWWTKYNYVLSAALDAGVAVGTVIIFFTLQYPLEGNIGKNTLQKWWGNTVHQRTLDFQANGNNGPALQQLQPGDVFGPTPLSFKQRTQ